MGITPPILFLSTICLPAKRNEVSREEAVLIDPPLAIKSRTPTLAFTTINGRQIRPTIAIEVFGSRLGKDMDAVLKLLDTEGRILAASDDEPGSGTDPRLSHVFRKNETAYIEVREVRYLGGKFYRLRVGDFPLPMAAFNACPSRDEDFLCIRGPPGELHFPDPPECPVFTVPHRGTVSASGVLNIMRPVCSTPTGG